MTDKEKDKQPTAEEMRYSASLEGMLCSAEALQYSAIQKYLENCRKQGIEPRNLAFLKDCFKVRVRKYYEGKDIKYEGAEDKTPQG